MLKRNLKLNNIIDSSIYLDVEYSYFETLNAGRKTVIISDNNVYNLYPDIFNNHNHIIIEAGEKNKNINTLTHIIEKLIELGIDRKSIIIGFGGGLVCDMTGFAATIFMRGIKFGFIPSTLLAQIDAAIGGKNGINSGELKNYIGTFSHPEFIICDPVLLKTLPDIEYKNGFGEILKYALIAGKDLYNVIYKDRDLLIKRDTNILNIIIGKCVNIKLEYIKADPYDTGKRHILNFGHSLGHCFEIVDNLPHGIAVVKGMIAALDLSLKFNYTTEKDVELIKKLFIDFEYDISYNLTNKHWDIFIKDKKKNSDTIEFIFFKNIGDVFVRPVRFDEIITALS